jgi:hypothetical protein
MACDDGGALWYCSFSRHLFSPHRRPERSTSMDTTPFYKRSARQWLAKKEFKKKESNFADLAA